MFGLVMHRALLTLSIFLDSTRTAECSPAVTLRELNVPVVLVTAWGIA